jgi:hypothetical protein
MKLALKQQPEELLNLLKWINNNYKNTIGIRVAFSRVFRMVQAINNSPI